MMKDINVKSCGECDGGIVDCGEYGGFPCECEAGEYMELEKDKPLYNTFELDIFKEHHLKRIITWQERYIKFLEKINQRE